jgi:putative hydrolase of the HAD superfamily
MKNVVFDLGGVIIKVTPLSIFKKLNIAEDEYKVLKAYFDNRRKLDIGEQSLEEKFDECNFPLELVNKYREVLIKYYELRDFNTDVLDLIKKLKADGFKVYILSDNNLDAAKYYRNHPLLSNIDGMMFSAEKKTLKREGILFDMFSKEFELVPEECYFIDDLLTNVEVANEHGFKGIVFDEKGDINKLYESLRK